MNTEKKIPTYATSSGLDLDIIIDEYTPYIKKVIDNMVGNNLNIEDK